MNNAVKAGATRQEVIGVVTIDMDFGGGPAFVIVQEQSFKLLR